MYLFYIFCGGGGGGGGGQLPSFLKPKTSLEKLPGSLLAESKKIQVTTPFPGKVNFRWSFYTSFIHFFCCCSRSKVSVLTLMRTAVIRYVFWVFFFFRVFCFLKKSTLYILSGMTAFRMRSCANDSGRSQRRACSAQLVNNW
jgi:hypothetical protein